MLATVVECWPFSHGNFASGQESVRFRPSRLAPAPLASAWQSVGAIEASFR
jgi:hypothetical protein